MPVQMISYELAMGLALLSIILMSGSLDFEMDCRKASNGEIIRSF